MQTLLYNRIIARAKQHIFNDMSGSNISKKEGDGYDFVKIRAHMYGDNVRRIDWKQSAKTGQLQQRVFFEEKEVATHIIGLMSGSMHFGISRAKQEVLAEVGALLGFSAVKNGDLFSMELFSENLYFKAPLSKKEVGIREGVKKALQSKLIGKGLDWAEVERYALYGLKKSSLLFFVGDFFELPRLEQIARKHSVTVIIVRDEFEEKPQNIGSLLVRDPISLEEGRVVVDDIFVRSYVQKRKEEDFKLEAFLKKNGIRFVKIYTHEEPFAKLSSFMRAY